MGLIDNRKGDLGVIEGRFIKHVLDDQAGEILKDSKKAMKGFKSAKWSKNKMVVDANTLTYDTIAATRFVDMKTRKVKGRKKDKESHEIHNRIIMGNYAGIMNELTYGLTDQMKKMMQDKIDKRQI